MAYSALYLKKGKKYLQILGVFAMLSFVLGISFFIQETGMKNGWKKISGIEKIHIINRTPHSFDIVWTASKKPKDEMWVEVGTQKGTYSLSAKAEHKGNTVFYAQVEGLKAGVSYYYRIRSGGSSYILPSLISDNVVTPKEQTEKPVSPAYGKVIVSNTKPYANGLLIYEVDGFYPLAVFTKQTGEWLIPLTGLIERKSNTITSVKDSNAVLIKLYAYPQGSIRSTIALTRPLKQAIVASTQVRLAQSITKKSEPSTLGVSTQLGSSNEAISARIMYPKENAIIPGSAPLIRGTAPSGKEVQILIQGAGKQYSYRTEANEKGDWLVQSPIALPFGRYTITATIQSGIGASTLVKRSFNIIKSGEQVLGEATGSPTLAPTVVVPTYANPTVIPTIAPTGSVVPSDIPTPTLLIPTRFVPTDAPPVTGGGLSPYLFGALFCIVIGAGLVLAF